MRTFPEIIPVQEVILEESAEELSSAQPSEKGWMLINTGPYNGQTALALLEGIV